jgi:hypothetical protein
MKTFQSDVDKVMAAFGAAPIAYRPCQDTSAAESRAPSTAPESGSSGATLFTPSARPQERILPGSGGRVREIFPLLWRAIPVVGDLEIGAIKRAGDEVPETADAETAAHRQLATRLRAATAPTPAAAPPAQTGEAGEKPAPVRPVAPQRVPPSYATLPVAENAPSPVTAAPLPPLRSHADLIRPIVKRYVDAVAERLHPAAPERQTQTVQQPGAGQHLWAAQGRTSQPVAPPRLTEPAPPAAVPQAPAPPGTYPPYYPAQGAQGMPPQGVPPDLYPMHPAAMGWPHLCLPPQGYQPQYGQAHPPPGAGYPPYPPAYPPPYPYGNPPPYPYGYPQRSQAGYAAPPPYPVPHPPPGWQTPEAIAAPAASAPASSASLSDIFAALQRAPGTQRNEET